MENLEEDLTCSVCYSIFDDPRVLPCSHTFCKMCLVNILQVSTNFAFWRPLRMPLKCPNCRSVVELPPNGVETLPINFGLRAIIKKYQRDKQRAPFCPEHHRQPLNVYCIQDCKPICGLCLTIGQHQGHAIDDLQTAYEKERHTPGRLVEQLTDRRWEEVSDLVDKLEQEKSQHESLIKQEREAVVQYFQELEHLLEHKKEAFMKVLDKVNGQLVCTYKPLIEKLNNMKEEQLELISIISSISEDESAPVFLAKIHHLRERVATLTQTELPEDPNLHISPSLEKFLEEHWANMMLGRLEDGPIPKISCDVKRRSSKEPQSAFAKRWTFKSLTVLAFLTSLLFLLLFSLNAVNGESLVFHNSSQINQAVTSLVHELSLPLHGSGTFLYCLLHELSLKFRSYISTVGERTYQHVALFLRRCSYSKSMCNQRGYCTVL